MRRIVHGRRAPGSKCLREVVGQDRERCSPLATAATRFTKIGAGVPDQ
jgi:hypothetical protein